MWLLQYLTDKILKHLPLFYTSVCLFFGFHETHLFTRPWGNTVCTDCKGDGFVPSKISPLPSWMFYRWSFGLSEPRDGKATILEGKEKGSVAEEWLVAEQLVGRFWMGCKWGFLKPGPPLSYGAEAGSGSGKGSLSCSCPALLSFLRRETLSRTGSCSQTLLYPLVCVWHAQGFCVSVACSHGKFIHIDKNFTLGRLGTQNVNGLIPLLQIDSFTLQVGENQWPPQWGLWGWEWTPLLRKPFSLGWNLTQPEVSQTWHASYDKVWLEHSPLDGSSPFSGKENVCLFLSPQNTAVSPTAVE